MSMFCRQCEQAAKNTGCEVMGVCGKNPEVAALQDLMLYGLIVAFAYTTLNTYLHFRDVELRYARLARAVALEGAQRPDN